MRFNPRRILPALAAVLLLPACGASSADAFSFTNAISAAGSVEKYRFETIAEVDGESLNMVCDIDVPASVMRCDLSMDGEDLTILADLAGAKAYFDVRSLVELGGSDESLEIPPGITWLELTLDDADGLDLGASPQLNNPLARISAMEGVSVEKDDEIQRNGETLRGYRVDLSRDTALEFMYDSDLPSELEDSVESLPETITYRFYVDESSTLRGFRYDDFLSPGSPAGTVEVWIDPASFASFSMPSDSEVMSLEELFGASMDAIVEDSVVNVVESAAASIARNTNALGVFNDSNLPTPSDLVTAVEEWGGLADEGWSVSDGSEILGAQCVSITYTHNDATATAHVRLSFEDGRAVSAAGPCFN